MKMELHKPGYSTLCFITISRFEALALIKSLSHQLLDESPNGNRLESRCTGDATELSIAVDFTYVSNG
jgi:hypothetical protein